MLLEIQEQRNFLMMQHFVIRVIVCPEKTCPKNNVWDLSCEGK
jgi:hypothetical protein